MSRHEQLRRARVRRAMADYFRRRPLVPDYLDVCSGCGNALDEALGRNGKREPLCRRCAFRLDDERRAAR